MIVSSPQSNELFYFHYDRYLSKLKFLLITFFVNRTQIENSESLRFETQNTIETLREEFDLLVKELAKYKKKEGKAASGNGGLDVSSSSGYAAVANNKGQSPS